jgi:hypothetical protein
MRAIYSLLILIGVVTSFPCRSEITKGFSKILLKPNGEVSFSLTSGVKIICGIPKGQWEEMAVYLSSTREYFHGKKKLKKGDVLTDSEGNKICIILSDSVEYMPMHNTENGEYLVRLSGYVRLQNIQASSIPENVLKDLLISKKNILTFDELKTFIQKFHFYKVEDFLDAKKYNCYFYYADYFSENNIHLVFENQNLIAVLHTRELKLPGTQNFQIADQDLLWLKSNSEKERSNFVKNYQKDYLSGG